MSEPLAWARWWFYPWNHAHDGWEELKSVRVDALCRAEHVRASIALNIAPSPPPPPHLTILRLALASNEQLQQMLALLGHICHSSFDGAVSEAQHLWCMRLSKAITVDTLLPSDADPLQLMLVWVDPAVWQRLRLRFAPQRVLQLEAQRPALHETHGRLDTLWKALVWRVTSPIDEDYRTP
ncbi:hypothetical protein BFW88_03110 [Pseudomonas fluorescens]|nr:hypothetical protein BFW88_03110 [Pseudomonas fluorescens]OPB13712.1 hypothetical protein BFW92_03100 [Pseudomonas fluorescens]OPB27342.1 hypothetical protein BFW93_03110 [Pseudomonas fluorescens]